MKISIDPTPNKRFSQFLEALHRETDRGAALTAAAFAEELLEVILREFLADVPETKELMMGFSAPIGSYASKIKFSYVLGLLDKDLFKGLNIIRKIRNMFAHQWESLSFDEQKIKDLVSDMPLHPISPDFPQSISPRDKFDSRVSAILMELCFIPQLAREQRRIPTRLIRFGKLHKSKEDADAEREEYIRTENSPWNLSQQKHSAGAKKTRR